MDSSVSMSANHFPLEVLRPAPDEYHAFAFDLVFFAVSINDLNVVLISQMGQLLILSIICCLF